MCSCSLALYTCVYSWIENTYTKEDSPTRVIVSSSIVTLLKAGETESFQGLCRVEKQRSCLAGERGNAAKRTNHRALQKMHGYLWHQKMSLSSASPPGFLPTSSGVVFTRITLLGTSSHKAVSVLTACRCSSFPKTCPDVYYFPQCWISCYENYVPGFQLTWYKKLE